MKSGNPFMWSVAPTAKNRKSGKKVRGTAVSGRKKRITSSGTPIFSSFASAFEERQIQQFLQLDGFARTF